MKRRNFLKIAAALPAAAELTAPAAAQSADFEKPFGELAHQTADAAAPLVWYTHRMTPEGINALITALITEGGWKPGAKTAIKMTFESSSGPRLDTRYVKAAADRVKATLIDNNGYSSERGETQAHLALAKRHGYADLAPVDILDAAGDMDLPVNNGYRLKYTRTGRHFAQYDSILSMVRFKAHYLPRYGGTLKNLSICMGSLSGKALIHSGGDVDTHYTSSDARTTGEAMADAVKAAMDAKPGRWAFIQVLDAVEPQDQCEGTRNLGDIGIFASRDPVALDQAAIDLTFRAAANTAQRRAWDAYHSTFLPELAEKIGVGKTHYRLKSVDGGDGK